MLRLFVKRCFVLPAISAACCYGGNGFAAEVSKPATLIKHTAIDGRVASAVVLKASEFPGGQVAHDHVILIDTSASQVGEHRQQSLAVLESLLKSLPAGDRVQLFAVDLSAEPLNNSFDDPQSSAVQASVDTLHSRVPLGATNLQGALNAALKAAEGNRSTDVTYIGDGMSTADLIELPELRELVTEFRQRRVPVHSFGVGPQLNLQLLGILAQQTGGYVSFDSQIDVERSSGTHSVAAANPRDKAAERGRLLAAALQTPVFFPTDLQVTPGGSSLLPNEPLPLRTDRETIYLSESVLPANTRLALVDSKSGESLEWKLAAPVEQRTATFLPLFAHQLSDQGGLTNSLAGMTLFQLAQSDFNEHVTDLVRRGQLALQQGQIPQATQLVQQAVQADPGNFEVKALVKAAGRLNVRPIKQTTTDAAPPEPAPDLEQRVAPNPKASLLDDQEHRIRVLTGKLRNEVSNAIESARRTADSDAALTGLKQVLGSVNSAIDISPEDRQRMQKQLQSEIQLQENQQEQNQQIRTRALERRAQLESQQRLAEQAMLDEERLENLIERVRSLMLEGKHGRDAAYGEAQEVADVAVNMRPGEGTSAAARFDSEAAQQLMRAYRLRARRDDQLLETLHLVELAHVPFPDEPPVRFPSAEVWQALTERRKQWKMVDLKSNSPNEKKIQQALTQSTEVAFTDTPLEEALDYLEDLHHIEIWVDKTALSDDGVNTDQPVTLVMKGITLRSALRLLLQPLGLTYIIEDEVMKITTQAKADEKTSTRVYPVGDLVIPIQPPMGGGMGMMGGMMGGGMGMMGGGMGGGMMGGGMGMMGGGMGMGSVPPESLEGSVPKDLPRHRKLGSAFIHVENSMAGTLQQMRPASASQ
jgi:tetratricopeptide (TPR) repeat protein